MPLLVADQANLGTAFGVYKALDKCGSVIMDVSAVQRSAVRGTSAVCAEASEESVLAESARSPAIKEARLLRA